MQVMLQQKGSAFKSFDAMLDSFTADKKQIMQNQLQQMGYDPTAVMNVLNIAGVPQDDPNIVLEALGQGQQY